MKNVAIYCSSRGDLPDEICEGAKLIASAIGHTGASLVYGGVNAGLMHVVAKAASAAHAPITGVVPEVFIHRADPLCTTIIPSEDLNDRKGKMIDLADLFVVLPGGIGTLDEWVSTLSHIMVRERVDANADKPILVWNANGMYDAMVCQLKETGESMYARGKRIDRSEIFSSATALAERLTELIG